MAEEKKDKSKKPIDETEFKEEIEQDMGAAEDEVSRIQRDLDKAKVEATEYLDNLKRLKAEFENFRKRMMREQSEVLKLAAQEIIISLLPVVDNFERALAHEVSDGQIEEYKGGMNLVYSQFVEALKKEGLESIEPAGEPFDPTRHEAMMKVQSDEHEEGAVVDVFEKGYSLNGRVIRPAKVSVAG